MSERVEHTILADWLSARMIIVAWLRELIPHVAPGAAEKAAEALIARFAAHEPPLLLLTPPAEPPLEHGVMLVVRSPRGDGVDLDGYIFLDVAHARRWLQQAFVTEERYMVTYCTFKCRPCCRERYAITRGLSLSVSAFLAETEPAAAAPPAAGEGGG